MNRTVRAATAALVLFAAQAALAQPGGPPAPDPAGLRGDSVQTRKRLAEAEQKIVGGKAADAADDLQRLLDESADDLVTLDGRQYRTARWVAHALLAKLPPDALKAYQDRIDRPAKALLDQARRDRDPRPLRQLLDRYFVSRPAGEALLLLGELLFERGEFRAAESEWRRLLPDAGADITYPGARADAAPVRARVALAVIFQNDAARAAEEVAAFRAKHPTAAGTLAGKTGPFVDTLGTFLAAPPKLPPDATGGTAWPTYGGGPDRAGRVPGGIPNSFLPQPTWRAVIPPYQRDNRGRPFEFPGGQRPPVRPPYGHPVVAGNEVYVADGVRVLGFDLRSGEKTRESPQLVNVPAGPDPACTLTAAGGLLYARCGPAAVRASEMTATGKLAAESFLVCLEPRPGERLVELWRVPPPEGDRLAAAWEGAPLVSGGRLWAVYAKFEGGRTVHVAVCYDPADPDRAPDRPAWTAELCDSPLPVAGGDRTRQELLTLAGRHLVFCSNGGAVVAVDAVTGRRAWAFRYARSRRAVNGATGDPAPAVAFGGKVFVAPADGERVYALDAETGRLLWESGPTEGARILGAARGRLVVTVTGPLRGVRALALGNGSYRDSDGGWMQGESTTPLTYGQGLVTDDVIVWPTRAGLFLLDAGNDSRYSKLLTEPLPAQARGYTGNVAYADGVLVVVTPTEVRGYVAESKKIVPRPDAPPPVKFDALVGRAEDELAAGNPAGASARFGDIAASDLPAPYRAWAAARMLQLAPPAGDPSRLPPGVRAALQPALLSEWILPPGGVPVTLGEFLQQKLGRSPVAASIPGRSAEDARCAPDLSADAVVDHELKLPPAVSPLRFIAGAASPPRRLFAAGPRVVVAVPLDGTAVSEHIPADLFTHAADLRDGFVAAGPFAVAVYGAARDPQWVFRVPTTDRLPTGPAFRFRRGHEPAPPHLSSFALAGPWLLARIGDGHFVALDLAARRVAWVLGASGRAGYEPEPFPGTARFGEHFAVCGKFAVVQLSDGRRWFVKLGTGRPVTLPALGDRTARAWWAGTPAVSGPDRLALADGPGMVRLVQLGGRVKWVYEADRDEGLTGEPAQARVWGVLADEENAERVPALVLVAVRRNSGIEIDRVDCGDGKRLWDEPAFVDADRIDLFAAAADADHVYIPAGNKLLAFTLNHGKVAWEADLPGCGGRGWVVRAGKTCVIAYPAEAIPAEPTAAVWERMVRSFRAAPFVWRLPGLATSLYDAWVDRTVPVLLFDPETGKQLARVDVPARGPAVTAWFNAGTAVVATGDRVVWLK